LLIQNEFFHSSNVIENKISGVHYAKIATILKENGEHTINYSNFILYRGKYVIDYEKIKQLKTQNYFAKTEIEELGKLVQNLELINNRKQAIHRTLESVIKYQSNYLKSGDSLDLKPLTQRELSRRLDISPSHVCRVIRYKSIETPWHEEKPLRYFFPNKKTIIKKYIEELLDRNKNIGSDRELKMKIEEELKLSISRRSVTLYRNELQNRGNTKND